MACLRVCTSRILVQVTVVLLLVTVLCRAEAETKKKQKNKEKIGKDITDYTDADVHRLLDQWDVSSLLIFVVWSAALENFVPAVIFLLRSAIQSMTRFTEISDVHSSNVRHASVH